MPLGSVPVLPLLASVNFGFMRCRSQNSVRFLPDFFVRTRKLEVANRCSMLPEKGAEVFARSQTQFAHPGVKVGSPGSLVLSKVYAKESPNELHSILLI
jgi:hypothetical protein